MSSNSSSVTITCKTLDNKNFNLTVSNMSSLASTYKNTVTKNKYSLPEKMNVVYYGDFVILCPNYTWGKNKIVPGNGGIYMYTQNFNGPITVKIKVTSTEYPISIINNNYVVILSKTKYTPKIVDTEKIYLSKVSLTPDPKDPEVDFDYIMRLPNYKTFEANHDIVEISDIYDNTAYTIAKICNKLAEINRTFSFDIISGTSFIFFFSMNFKRPHYMPILFTKSNKYKNMFTADYLDKYFNYYPNHTAKKHFYTFVQIIDFTTTADTVNILILRQDSGRLVNAVFSPSKSPYTLYCPATDDLPQTFVGKSVKVNCPSGYSGYHEYKCEKEGVWKNIYSNCQQIACEAADNFTRTIAGQTATKNCPTGYTGSITRRCSESGVWEDEVNSCTLSVNNSEPSKSESENNNYMIYIILIIIVVIIVIIIIIIIRVKSQSKKEINRFRLK